MPDGSVQLAEMIRRLNALDGMAERAAPRVATAARAEVVDTASRQSGPDGQRWEPRKDGHGSVLQGVHRVVQAVAVGSRVVLRIDGHYARHHIGAVKGGIKRQILPTGKIPDPMTRAIERVVEDEFRATMGGSR